MVVSILIFRLFCRRLKKVQGKKKRDAAIEEEKRKAMNQEQPSVIAYELDESGGNLLSSKDEDVIF